MLEWCEDTKNRTDASSVPFTHCNQVQVITAFSGCWCSTESLCSRVAAIRGSNEVVSLCRGLFQNTVTTSCCVYQPVSSGRIRNSDSSVAVGLSVLPLYECSSRRRPSRHRFNTLVADVLVSNPR